MALALAALAVLLGPLHGVWESVGYGLIWSFEGAGLATFEVTTTTCVVSTRYRFEAPADPGVRAGYRAENNIGAVANDWIIRTGSTPSRLVAHVPGTLSDVEFRSVRAVPTRCTPPTPADRGSLFEIYQRTVAEHYAFFAERRMDWPATVAAARAGRGAATSDTAFYQLLQGMVAPLQDAHTKVIAPTLGLNYPTYRRTEQWIEGDLLARLRDLAPIGYLRDSLVRFDGGRLQVGWLRDSIGYLKVTALYNFTQSGRFEDDSIALAGRLDQVLGILSHARGLVLDLRINGGGYDGLARMLAGRLTGQPYPALVKRARSDPRDQRRLTRAAAVGVVPGRGPRYLGPLVVLTGIRTVSAGEVLTLMLLARRPRPTLIGQPTQGVFADELVRRLPNGWQFQLSSERYTTPAGRTFEGPGIPPDIAAPVFPADERDGRKDTALEKALASLGRH